MHRCDPQLKQMKAESANDAMHRREEHLLPLYTAMATDFADLHDKAPRMKRVKVIRDEVQWSKSREFFYWRLRRRILECDLCKLIQKSLEVSIADAIEVFEKIAAELFFGSTEESAAAWKRETNDQQCFSFLEQKAERIQAIVRDRAGQKTKSKLEDMFKSLSPADQKTVLAQF